MMSYDILNYAIMSTMLESSVQILFLKVVQHPRRTILNQKLLSHMPLKIPDYILSYIRSIDVNKERGGGETF